MIKILYVYLFLVFLFISMCLKGSFFVLIFMYIVSFMYVIFLDSSSIKHCNEMFMENFGMEFKSYILEYFNLSYNKIMSFNLFDFFSSSSGYWFVFYGSYSWMIYVFFSMVFLFVYVVYLDSYFLGMIDFSSLRYVAGDTFYSLFFVLSFCFFCLVVMNVYFVFSFIFYGSKFSFLSEYLTLLNLFKFS